MTQACIAIAGGGIAGTACCISLDQIGIRPLWIAEKQTAHHRDHIGETLSPAANPILEKIGLLSLLRSAYHRPANSIYSAWGSGRLHERNAAVHLEGPGLILDRPVFDGDLYKAAQETDPQHVTANVSHVERKSGKWELSLSNGESYRADFLLDCTGSRRIIASTLSEIQRIDHLVCAHCFLKQVDTDITPTPATVIEAVENGWWYATLLPDQRLVISYFSDPDLLPCKLYQDIEAWHNLIEETNYIHQWIRTAGFSVPTPPRLSSAGTKWQEPATGDRWAAVGDAACVFDPLSSHGITTALWMAYQASQFIPDSLKGDLRLQEQYTETILRGGYNFLYQRTQIYAQETRFSDSPFWKRRHPSESNPTLPAKRHQTSTQDSQLLFP